MPISISQSATAIGLGGNTAIFSASGGVSPYVFSLLANGPGGSIGSSSGIYTSPNTPTDYKTLQKIRVTDAAAETADADLIVGPPVILFCEILQKELNLENGRVYLWDQKFMAPKDSAMYIAVSMPICKPYANIRIPEGQQYTLESQQWVNIMAVMDIDVISRSLEAFYRKDEILLALNSQYSQQQQNAYGFQIAKLPVYPSFKNLSEIDGTAIPYRYRISVNMNYAYARTKDTEFFDSFSAVGVYTDQEIEEQP